MGHTRHAKLFFDSARWNYRMGLDDPNEDLSQAIRELLLGKVLELIDNLLVAAYLIPTLFGFILVAPFGKSVVTVFLVALKSWQLKGVELLLVYN